MNGLIRAGGLVFALWMYVHVLGLGPQAACAQSVADQSFVPSVWDSSALISSGYSYEAQTVTAGFSGYLTQVDLAVYASYGRPTLWDVTVNATQGGVPTGSVLATQLVTSPGAGRLPPGLVVAFEAPAYLSAGEQFALVVSTPGVADSPMGAGSWSGSYTEDYPGGMPWASQDGITFGGASPYGDQGFVTYMSATPESATVSPLALGGLALLRRRPRRASPREIDRAMARGGD
jgi:hypothetical protein